MRYGVVLLMTVGLLVAVPGTAQADTTCAEFNGADDAGKLAAVQEAAAAGNAIAQISPPDAVSLAVAMCRVRVSETVVQVLNSDGKGGYR
ncbi:MULTISPECIES: hypothetical protein [Mycobacteroides]|jgi:hypothetical protein|uniref:Uncharacterized protein n=1 Tax=Mycobacteroides chelonae TaxID=1774 RepID=A0A1S1LM95_MYCCH|nr:MULTISPECIES: hypothetical protein [Mycobacteroides]KRQ22921.1 hypothetical protein AOT87_12630 [Mycobacteroides sp. H003]KRQ33733.1 hypothetical protein AOT91_07100 [Mycobacteroides sp. H092]KRQ39655.1 hypothetical protein AOT92_15845 [Mycobacteroides sp. H101]KRQ46345.1 hypothetical protein AOT88_17175 [Mycobacteroides sp. H063]KRQ62417.1 hypothetical protein AOT89_19700 [Mycobacteroides sp. H070]